MRCGTVLLMTTLATTSASQEIVDALGEAIPTEHLEAIIGAVSAELPGPLSAQFRNLRRADMPGAILYCGEVNVGDSLGEHLGFEVFSARLAENGPAVLLASQQTEAEREVALAALTDIGCLQ
jgi:hypothetical protein